MPAKFKLGQIVATPGALALEQSLLAHNGTGLIHYLARHVSGDWGEVCEEDRRENEISLARGFRLFSSYSTPAGKLWVITEADRSATTFLRPDEY